MGAPKVLYPDAKILIIDDEVEILFSLSTNLGLAGYETVETLADGRLAMDRLEKESFSCILLDLLMPQIPGKILLENIAEKFPHIPVIIITALDDLETVVSCVRAGAHDYLSKPVSLPRLLTTVENAIRFKSVEEEKSAIIKNLCGKEVHHPKAFSEIVTGHPRMKSIFMYLKSIAATPYPVLITGESGTGKGLIAKGLRQLSRSTGEFISISVAGLDDTLFTDTLFGHKKGAFTGADTDREGLLRKAENGVIFLDEIGDLELPSQVKLLRLLQEREYHTIGSDELRSTNAKFILATNRNLEKLKEEGKFRFDLYYRITTHSVHIPPLRERKEDLPFLLKHFIRKHADILGKRPPGYRPQLLEFLSLYSFPGNVRELENLISNAVAVTKGKFISVESVEKAVKFEPLVQEENLPTTAPGPDIKPNRILSLRDAEAEHIASVVRYAKNNLSLAARLLGIDYTTLFRKLKKGRRKR